MIKRKQFPIICWTLALILACFFCFVINNQLELTMEQLLLLAIIIILIIAPFIDIKRIKLYGVELEL